MIGTGSEPTTSNCTEAFPDHKIVPTAGSQSEPQYMAASGDNVPNLGGCHVAHSRSCTGRLRIVFKHGPVKIPDGSTKDDVSVGCMVCFVKVVDGSNARRAQAYSYAAPGGHSSYD